MKLTKTTWICLVVGAIVISALSLGWTYSQQTDQQSLLEKNLTSARQRLALIKFDDLNAQKAQSLQQIEEFNAQLKTVTTSLSSSKNSIEATNIILEDAKSFNVDINEMSSEGRSTEDLAGVKCETLVISLKVKGNLQNIADFAVSLSQKFPTSVEKLVKMERLPPTPTPTPTPTDTPALTPVPGLPQPPPGFTPIPGSEKDFSASLNVVIYNYKGE
jgi:hypothetical protein